MSLKAAADFYAMHSHLNLVFSCKLQKGWSLVTVLLFIWLYACPSCLPKKSTHFISTYHKLTLVLRFTRCIIVAGRTWWAVPQCPPHLEAQWPSRWHCGTFQASQDLPLNPIWNTGDTKVSVFLTHFNNKKPCQIRLW